MWFFFLISWLATAVQVCLATLALAAGLYYMAELVEEYTVVAAKCIRWLHIGTAAIYIGLILFEDLPYSLTLVGLFSVFMYSLMLKNFPFIELTSPPFIVSCVLVIVNHYMAFSYFADVWHPFSEVLAYFTLCLWLVPFAFFVSLSAGENILPTTQKPETGKDDVVSSYFSKKSKRNGLLAGFNFVKESVLPERSKAF
ncbi:protein TEX261 [Strongylocentrotus purpuratus]|uniref:Protein TEX261 n=1 Tax=Strongylocentrotus purpuratus TaxID=7668 RepID=A0A7M7SZ55_STRPU|nr:protein TEX261 [Strongylocentrotus purpuratus]